MIDDSRARPSGTGSREPGLASRPGPSGFDPARLAELAERCEQATGPDQRLDALIQIALDPDKQTIVGTEPGRFPQSAIFGPVSSLIDWLEAADNASDIQGIAGTVGAQPYTASLDAAMTLVPDGWGFAIGEYMTPRRRPFARTFPPDFANSPLEHQESDDCATAPLALCAAALKARAASVDRGPEGQDAEERLDRNDESAVGEAETPKHSQEHRQPPVSE